MRTNAKAERMSEHLIIVGAGQAAAQAVLTLRQHGYAGDITLVGEEPYAPYQRPPLSKKFLSGELERERLLLRPPSFYAEKRVALELGARAVELDPAVRTLRLGDGRSLHYDRLLLATGSRVRKLDVPGADRPNVLYLRTIEDVDLINATLAPGARAVLVGAGYIGLEVAAVLVKRGHDVTVLEAADRVMARVVSPQISQFYARRHTEEGVKLCFGAAVRGFGGTGARADRVEIEGGRSFPCDVAIVGIGVVPNVELGTAAGLPAANGLSIDEHCRTADPLVLAAGDCTNQWLALYERRVRLESVQNAIQQAKLAAHQVLGTAPPAAETPWFWSDQYDLKLQIAGLSDGYEEVVVRGDPASHSFAAYYLAGGVLIAVDAVNSPRDFIAARKLVAGRAEIAAAALADPSTDIAALAAAG